MSFEKENFVLDTVSSDCLIITTDFCNRDIGALLVTRRIDDFRFEIVNEFHGNEALDLYNKLTGK